jgi:hypothetical protein
MIFLCKLFCFEVFSKKRNLQCDFGDNLALTHVFIKQIFRAAEQGPPCPPPLIGKKNHLETLTEYVT